METIDRLLCNTEVNVDVIDVNGRTALMLAALNGHTDIVNALAGTHGANVDAVNRDGRTALMLAASEGHTATVNALAGTHGANVDAVDEYGRTALMSCRQQRPHGHCERAGRDARGQCGCCR